MEKLKLQKIIMERLSYILLQQKEQKQYIDQILKLEGLKKNPVALTIGTIKKILTFQWKKEKLD